MLHIQIRAVVESIPRIILVRRMQVYDARMTVGRQNSFDPFHRYSIKSHIIQVNSIYTDILHEPVHPLHIVVVPAAPAFCPTVDQRRVLDLRHKPGGNIVVRDMLLQPTEPTSRPGHIDLAAQAAKRKQLIRMIRQFPDGIIDLHLQP